MHRASLMVSPRPPFTLSEYRKMRPGPIEERIFFDHPSGYDRIHSAMVWKGSNLELFEKVPCPPQVH
jgi:hypothetical protein